MHSIGLQHCFLRGHRAFGTHVYYFARMDSIVIRAPERHELAGVGALAAQLVAQHHAFDPLRFMLLPEAATGYARYLGSVLGKPDLILLAAFDGETVVGYAYATELGRDYMMLREPAGGLHDLFVDPAYRGRGLGRRLLHLVFEAFAARGLPRVVLFSASQNPEAQKLFAREGFRPTLVEMTKELEPTKGRSYA
jgi:ribosomal protein S18 acetylase RimI-like enzyme